MPMTPRELIVLLKHNGFEEVSQNGSHVKMKNFQTGKQTIIPYHNKALKKGQMCIRDSLHPDLQPLFYSDCTLPRKSLFSPAPVPLHIRLGWL